jgi:hypothetical protein
MNINDVSKREILDFDQFRKKVHDYSFKPLAPENQEDSTGKSGLHKIKREPAYDWVGYADAVFSPEKAGIEVPGYNSKGSREYVNGVGATEPGMIATMDTSESLVNESTIIRLKDF